MSFSMFEGKIFAYTEYYIFIPAQFSFSTKKNKILLVGSDDYMSTYSAKEMAQRIKAQRKNLGYTQDEMAALLDLSASSYTKIENAFQNPSLETLIKLSQELKMSIDYMIFGEQNREKDMRLNDALTAVAKIADVDKLTHANDILGKVIKALKTTQ